MGTEGFLPVGGGFRGSDSPETLCIVARVGFGDFKGGFLGLFTSGEGVRCLMGPGIILDAFGGVAVTGLLAACRLTTDGEDAFCSNMPIKDVVGGIGLVSKA